MIPPHDPHYNWTATSSPTLNHFNVLQRFWAKTSWGWLKYKETGFKLLIAAASHLILLTFLVAGLLYIASKVSLQIKRDPDTQRRNSLKKKVKMILHLITPLVLLPAFIGAYFWEKGYYARDWSPGKYSNSMVYPGLFIGKTFSEQAAMDLIGNATSPSYHRYYESEDLRRMYRVDEVYIPALNAAYVDIACVILPPLVLLLLVSAVLGLIRRFSGGGVRQMDDEKIMA